MLERNYINYPESRQYNMDDIDKQYVNENERNAESGLTRFYLDFILLPFR